MKENGLILKEARRRLSPIETIADSDYTDALVLLANKPVVAKSFLYIMKHVARGVRFYLISDKTNFICLNTMELTPF